MSGLGPLGIGVIVAFIVFILFVMIEIYSFILKKKKRRTRDRRGMMMSIEETHQRSCEVVIMHEVYVNKPDASEISNTENVNKWPSIGFMKTKMKKCMNWLILRSIGMAKDSVIMLQWSLLKISYYISRKSIDGNREGIDGKRDGVCESTDVKVPMDMKKKRKKKHGVERMISDGFEAHKEEEEQERKIREDCVGEGEECEDEDEDIFKIGGLWGPPRLLFTIAEETKEEMDLELDEEKKPDDDNKEEEEEEEEEEEGGDDEVPANSRGKNGDGNSRKGSRAASSSSTEFLQLLMVPSSSSCSSPYLTPPSSPPFITPLGSPAYSSSVALSKLHLPPSCLIIPSSSSSSSSSVEFDNVSSSSTNSSSSPLPQSRPSFDESSSSSSSSLSSSSSSASFSSSSSASSSSQSFSPPPLMMPRNQQRGPLSLLFHEPLSSTASLSPSSSLYHAHIRRVHPISPPPNPLDGNPISSSSSSFKKSPSAELSSVVSPSSACTNCPPRFVIPAFSKPTTPSPFRHVFQQKICNGHRVSLQIQ